MKEAKEYWKIKYMKEYLDMLDFEGTEGKVTRDESQDIKTKISLMIDSWEDGYERGFSDGFDKEREASSK